jgi:hypothetical protein
MKIKPSKEPAGIKLGSLVKDSISGFTGIATSRTEYIYGCVHIGITATRMNISGHPIDTVLIDEQRVVVLDKRAPAVSKDSAATSGGPTPVSVIHRG